MQQLSYVNPATIVLSLVFEAKIQCAILVSLSGIITTIPVLVNLTTIKIYKIVIHAIQYVRLV